MINKLKTVLIFFSVICLIIYLSFLFVLPQCVNSDKFSKIVEENFYKQTGYDIRLNNPTISTSFNLNLTCGVEKADIFFNKEKFAQINDLKINIALLPLVFKTIKITDVKASKLMVEIPQNLTIPQPQKINFIFFEKLPDVNIDYFRISLKDYNTIYSLKGNNLIFHDNFLLKNLKLSANSKIYVDKKENIVCNLNLIFKNNFDNSKQIKTDEILNIFRNIKTYDVSARADINADLSNLPEIKGIVNILDISFKCNGKRLPKSFINLIFNKETVRIKSDIFTDIANKISINGNFNFSDKKNIDLKILSDEINLKDLLLIAKTFTKASGINILDSIFANGSLKANFNIQSDFKQIRSSGDLILKNGNFAFQGYSLNNCNAEIDFNDNKINLKDTVANFMNNPIFISGTVDSTAYANITVKTKPIKLKDLFDKNFIKDNDINGFIVLNAFIKGNLKNALPQADLKLSKLNIKNKKLGYNLKNDEILILLKGKDLKLKTNSIILSTLDGLNSVLIPNFKANINNDVLEIEKTNIWIDNVKAEMSGNIINILKSPAFDNVKIFIPTQNNLSGPMNSKISVNGEMNLSGNIDKPKLKGNINIPKLVIPSDFFVLQNATISADGNIRISCPYISINSSVIRLNALIENITNPEIKTVNIYSDFIDVNKMKKFARKQSFYPVVKNGTFKANKVIVNGITAENIVSGLSLKNKILSLKNLTSDAYSGKIAADIEHNISNDKTTIYLQARGIDSYEALKAVSGEAQDIHGRCDIDTKLSFSGDSQKEIIKTLKGDAKFIINTFVSDNLGKLDYLIQAQNILSNRALQSSLNVVKNALKIKNLGVYNTAKGQIHFDKGYAYINGIKLAGPSMSLYIKGRYFIPDNTAFLLILGKVSDDIVTTLGPLGRIDSGNNSYFSQKIGSVASAFLSDVTTASDIEDIKHVPDLTVKTNFKTQEFKVLINGRVDKQTSVKSFKWIKQNEKQTIYSTPKQNTQKNELPEFIQKIPDIKK